MKVKHILLISFIVLLLLLLVAGCFLLVLFGAFLKPALGIEEVGDGLYALEYVGDYGLEEFLNQGGAHSDKELADFLVSYLSRGFYKAESSVETGPFGCSTLSLKDEKGNAIYGRNFDWESSQAMIVHTKPKDGYESISTCCLDFLGFGSDFNPTSSMSSRFMSLAAIYVPLDGMNEKGLIVADLVAGDEEATHQRSGKTPLTTTTAIRLLLDYCADVEEALALLDQYDMNSSIDSAHHLAISDKSGRSVVVEYVNGEMLVAETKVVTNFYLTESEKKGIGSEQSHLRYDRLMGVEGSVSEDSMRDALSSVAQSNYPQDEGSYDMTVWSIVYHPSEGKAVYFFHEDFETRYDVVLGNKSFLTK